MEFASFGEPLPGLHVEMLASHRARCVYVACNSDDSFELVEFRKIVRESGPADVIVVDCLNGEVPSRNSVGIMNRERLALIFCADANFTPEVRPLRKDFPITAHQNHVLDGEPASLCLYQEAWATVERTWTPKNFLRRILWWLSAASRGILHAKDQAVERLFFRSPFDLVLPIDFENKVRESNAILELVKVPFDSDSFRAVIGSFHDKSDSSRNGHSSTFIPILCEVPPTVHGTILRLPITLGELHDRLIAIGYSLVDAMIHSIRTFAKRICNKPDIKAILILTIPITRSPESPIERLDYVAFLVVEELSKLGQQLDILGTIGNIIVPAPIIGVVPGSRSDWRTAPIAPLDLVLSHSPGSARRASGVSEESAAFKGVIAGVGALGCQLAEQWSRCGWGTWSLVDDDHVKPHNLTRHLARAPHIGLPKVTAVADMLKWIYANEGFDITAIPRKLIPPNEPTLNAVIEAANLIVDATATLDVGRELAVSEVSCRACSVFLSPSGLSSILLLEDAHRTVRLDSLESQYYRAILRNRWGEQHLIGLHSLLQVGASCRDVSAIISYDLISIHAALLARQIRRLRERSEPHLSVWEYIEESGSVIAHEVPVSPTIRIHGLHWKVLWDEGLRADLVAMRSRSLPNETGGVLLGYVDQKTQTIVIVDALPAPTDSLSEMTGFVRGIQGLSETIGEVSRRSAGMVSYIGEWHSHPNGYSIWPSGEDVKLLGYLRQHLAEEGQPGLILIVGERDCLFAIDGENLIAAQ